jgi:hypothetical protein
MVICNPPYIPRPGERNNNAYEGLGLIAKFAQRGRRLLADDGLLLLNISTLAGERPLTWFDQYGWQLDVLDRMRVPLKVNAVTSGGTPEARAWYDYLSARGAIPAQGERGYRLWHELRMYACRPHYWRPSGPDFSSTRHEPRRRCHGRKVGLLLRARRRPKQEPSEDACLGRRSSSRAVTEEDVWLVVPSPAGVVVLCHQPRWGVPGAGVGQDATRPPDCDRTGAARRGIRMRSRSTRLRTCWEAGRRGVWIPTGSDPIAGV